MGFPALKQLLSKEWWFEPLGEKNRDRTEGKGDSLPPVERQIRSILELPENAELIRALNGEFDRILPFERVRVIDDVIYRFAHYVLHLQASENHHHAFSYGLLEHSLQVALDAVRRMRNTSEVSDPREAGEGQGHDQLVYGCFVLGLLHDVGKCYDVVVEARGSARGPWNPNVEPLASYKKRTLPEAGPESPPPSYIARRGPRAHQWRGVLLWNGILPRPALELLGMRFQAQLVDAWIEYCFRECTPAVPWRAHWVVETVAAADEANTKAHLPEPEGGLQGSGSGAVRSEPEVEEIEVPRLVRRDLRGKPPTPEDFVTCFKGALRFVIEKGIVPLNRRGGIFVGVRYIFISWYDAYVRISDVMKFGGFWPAENFDRMAALFNKLVRYEGWIDSENTPVGRNLVVEGITPRGKCETFDVLKREVLDLDLPVFEGEITVYHKEDYEDPTVDEIAHGAERGDERMGYGGAARAAEERRKRRVVLNPRRRGNVAERQGIARAPRSSPSPAEVAPPPPPPPVPPEPPSAQVEEPRAGGEKPESAEGNGGAAEEEPRSAASTEAEQGSREMQGLALPLSGVKDEILRIHAKLTSQQELFRSRMGALVEEYKERVRRSRLIVFKKSRNKGEPVSRVYWGIFMKTKNGSERSKRWIHHVATGLNDTLIYKVARKQEFRDYLYDIDRRRLALNRGLEGLNQAVNTMECMLVRRGKKFGKGATKVEGSLEDPLDGLMADLAGYEDELSRLAVKSKEISSSFSLSLEAPVPDRDGAPGEGCWVKVDGTPLGPKLTRKILSFLGVDRADWDEVMGLEERRREVRDLQKNAWRIVARIRKVYEEAWPASEEALAEAAKIKVDRYGCPIEDISEPMTEGELKDIPGESDPSGGDGEFPNEALENDELGEDVGQDPLV